MTRLSFKQWLLQRADRPRQNLLFLLLGFGLFAPGIGLIVLAEFLLVTSWQQELLALLGLILSVALKPNLKPRLLIGLSSTSAHTD